MTRRADRQTLDLFGGATPPVVQRFDDDDIRAATLAGRLSRAVAKTLKDCGLSRQVVAMRMSDYLGDSLSVATLEAYASQAKDSHRITAERLIAMAVVTGDARLLNALLAGSDYIAVHKSTEHLIRREVAKDRLQQLQRVIAEADADWKAGR